MYTMSDQDTHEIAYNGQRYEVIELGDHPHAHGQTRGHEGESETYGTYRCFECGKTTTGDTLDDARSNLKEKSCD